MNSSLARILAPRSVAVIGASRTPHTIGYEIVAALVRNGFTGAVYPVNPNAHAIHSLPAYPDIGSVPEPVDLAVVVVPKQSVDEVVAGCAEKQVGGLVIISSGFREIGGEGVERERRLLEFVRAQGIRMVGPNCMGVLNGHPDVSMNATFAPHLPPFGRAAFVSQSGALGLSVLDYAREYGIGIGQFVSVGNKADVSSNDLLAAWEEDPDIGVILMYVENFGNPRRFLEIASRITRVKPIIVVKSGRSKAGAQAAKSHTGALAASDVAVDALLAQAGVLRAGTVEELFDLAMAFSGQPYPRSRRTAVLTNVGGPGILAADAMETYGMEVPELAPATIANLQQYFPEEASVRNPLDMIASATPSGYRAALSGLLADPGIDSAVAIFVPPLGVRQEDVTEAIARVAVEHPTKPVLAVLMGHEGLPQGRAALAEAKIPAYIFPEAAARALNAMCRVREWQERPRTPPESLGVDRTAAARIIAHALDAGQNRLNELEALELLGAYGIPIAPARLAVTPEAAAAAAEGLGFPVVLKVMAPEIVHKTDVGGVIVGLATATAVRAGAESLLAEVAKRAPTAAITGLLVQKQVTGGIETIVGSSRDPAFGPLIMFGLGGIFVEVLRDVVFRVAPIGRTDARDMIRTIRGAGMLDGVRGAAAANHTALENVLMRLSQLAFDFAEIQEIDLNPVLARPADSVAIDARVILSPRLEGRTRVSSPQ